MSPQRDWAHDFRIRLKEEAPKLMHPQLEKMKEKAKAAKPANTRLMARHGMQSWRLNGKAKGVWALTVNNPGIMAAFLLFGCSPEPEPLSASGEDGVAQGPVNSVNEAHESAVGVWGYVVAYPDDLTLCRQIEFFSNGTSRQRKAWATRSSDNYNPNAIMGIVIGEDGWGQWEEDGEWEAKSKYYANTGEEYYYISVDGLAVSFIVETPDTISVKFAADTYLATKGLDPILERDR